MNILFQGDSITDAGRERTHLLDNYDLWHERTVIAREMVKDIAKKYNTEL